MTRLNWRTIVALLVLAAVTEVPICARAQESVTSGKSAPATSSVALPKDVYPESLARLPLVHRDDLDEPGKKFYDYYVSPAARTLAGLQGPGRGLVPGPGGILLHSPRVAELYNSLNAYLRYKTDLNQQLTELAILVAAREMNSQFEWAAHEPAGREEGLEQEIIDVVKYRKDPAGLGEKEAVIISFGREMFRRSSVSSQTFAHALKVFGNRGVVNLAELMGTYASTALFLRALDMQLPPGQKPLLPAP